MATKIFDKVLTGDSLDELLNSALRELNECNEVESRLGDNTKELIGMSILMKNPRNNWMLSKERKHNIFHQIGESLGVLSGNLDMEYLMKFLPGAKYFSDDYDEKTGTGHWRADYANRIRHFKGVKANSFYGDERETDIVEVDQLKNVYEELKAHANTRRAVIVLWSPADDGTFPESLDYPCNDMVQFIIRNNELHMIVTQRSSDCIWGFSAINAIEFPLMQRILASSLNLEVGTYRHQMGSFHIYDKHYDRADSILEEYKNFDFEKSKDPSNSSEFEKVGNFEKMDYILQTMYNLEMTSRHYIEGINLSEKKYNDKDWFEALLSIAKRLSKKYPNIVGTFAIPLIYKRDLENETVKEFLKLINKATLHPALRNIVDQKIKKMMEKKVVSK